MTMGQEDEKKRVLFSTLLPAVRIATGALTPLKEMKKLVELAYYREARRQQHKLKEICELLSISMRPPPPPAAWFWERMLRLSASSAHLMYSPAPFPSLVFPEIVLWTRVA